MGSVVVGGRTIHYHAAGDPDRRAGHRVLYVHGTGCSGEVWAPHMAAIADRHAAVAIDLPGHGKSPGRGFRGVADYAYFVVELAAALGWDRFVLAGHSLGGAIAQLTALYHPQRLDGLLLVDTGARLRVDPALLRGAREALTRGRGTPTDRAWAFSSATPQSVVDAVHALNASIDPSVTYGDWIADDTFDVMSRVKEIRVPTQLICGADDRLTPVKYHRFLEAQISAARLTIIDNAGHWVFWEQPEAFTRAVRAFLDALPPSTPAPR
jgi:pimeloyl-ACP methyl ester carboxylesterase